MFVYLSRTILCAGTRTNWPRTKNTPSSIDAEAPVAVAAEVNNTTELSPILNPPTALLEARFSPSTNSTVSFAIEAPVVELEFALFVAVVKYFT